MRGLTVATQVPAVAQDWHEGTELYHLIAEGIPNMVWTARPDGGLDFVNRRVFEYTGLTAAELREWGWRDVIHPEDMPMCEARWRQSLETGASYEIEYRVRRGSDASYRWHIGAALPLRHPDGRIAKWFGTCTDIEDQKLATYARYRSLVEMSPDAMAIRQGDNFAFVNQATLRLLGAKATDELIGKSVYDLVHPEDLAMVRQRQLKHDVYGEALPPAEVRMRRANGDYVTVDAISAPMEFDGRAAALMIWRDLTPRKRADQALRDSEAQMSLAMQTAQMAHWSWSAGEGLNYSEGMGPLFGLERGLQYPRTSEWIKVVHPDDRDALLAAARESFASGRLLHHDWRVVKPDGSVAWMSSRAQTQYDDSGRAARMIGITMDITQLRRVQDELEQYSERVKQLLYRLVDAQESERRNLASSLHDLIGQKLTALNIGLDILKRDMHATAGALARSRLDSMATIVDETVDAVRGVMQDLRPSELEDFGLVPALHSHAKRFQEQTGIRTTVEASEPYGRLQGNVELAFFRVAQEALTNAVKHSGAGHICIRAWQERRRASLAIEDDGRGFADPRGARSVWRGGWGVPEMRKRAEAVGGQLQIEFPDTGGTRVLMHVELGDAD